jgi:hypothetical protein
MDKTGKARLLYEFEPNNDVNGNDVLQAEFIATS